MFVAYENIVCTLCKMAKPNIKKLEKQTNQSLVGLTPDAKFKETFSSKNP